MENSRFIVIIELYLTKRVLNEIKIIGKGRDERGVLRM
jgi:hypothetical protein